MKKQSRQVVGWIVLCLFLSPALVQARPGVKQGYIDLQLAIDQVCDGKLAKRRLRKRKRRYQKQINTQQRRLQRLKRRFDRRKAKMSRRQRARTFAKLQREALSLRQLFGRLRKRLRHIEQQETRPILRRMQRLIGQISRRHKLIFMFEWSSSRLLYADKTRNFTQELVNRYKKRHCHPDGRPKPTKGSKGLNSSKLRLRLKEMGIDIQ